MIRPHPPRLRMKRRKTVSVTPAMGASTVAGEMRNTADAERSTARPSCCTHGSSDGVSSLADRSARATCGRIVPELLHRLILPAATKRSPRRSEGSIPVIYPRESAQIRGVSYLRLRRCPLLAYLRRKRSTRPAVSISFCLPVKNGWQFEQISTQMSPLWVDRVTKALPQAQWTRTSL